MVETRLIRSDEIDGAKALMSSCFPASYAPIFFLYKEHTLVSVEGERLLGGINSDVFMAGGRKIGYIGWLYTAEEARGKGIASSLKKKMVEHLEEAGCEEIFCLIEGDNPSSYKIFQDDFRIMNLSMQVKAFGTGIFKVWKKSAHFLDSGYFLWHRGKGIGMEKTASADVVMLLFLNAVLFTLHCLIHGTATAITFFIPLFVLASRTAILAIAGGRSVLVPWDNFRLLSLASVILPIYIPTPIGVYPVGGRWSMAEKRKRLGLAAVLTILFEAAAVVCPVTGRFTVFLLLADSSLFFYPFSGFQAARARRLSAKFQTALSILSIALIVAVEIL